MIRVPDKGIPDGGRVSRRAHPRGRTSAGRRGRVASCRVWAVGIIGASCYHRRMTMMLTRQQRHLRALAALFHSLSDGTRLAILQRLADGEARVADLVADLGLAQSTVSAHIACLKDCGLVEGRPEGRQIFYRLTISELMHLLGDAEVILDRTDQAVLDCPIFGDHRER